MQVTILLVFFLVGAEWPGSQSQPNDWFPTRWLVHNEDADLMLGVTIPVTKETDSKDECAVLEQSDLQILQSLIFALDYVNSNRGIYPFSLGAVVLDSCDNPKKAVQNTMKLVLPILLQQLGPYYYYCPDNGTVQSQGLIQYLPWQVVGIIGSETSDDCIQMASVIQMSQIPQISHLATSSELSDIEKYPFFMRTVPSDRSTVRAIISLLISFNWTYISAVYDDSLYSLEGFSLFEEEARASGICFATTEKIPLDNYDIVNQILQKLQLADATGNASVVVVFASYDGAKMFFRGVCDSRLADDFVWIGVDSWIGRGDLSINDNCDVFEHSLGVAMKMYYLEDFDETFTSYRPSDCRYCNIWMTEYFENRCNCTYPKLPSADENAPGSCNLVEDECAEKTLYVNFMQDAYVSYMFSAVLAYAEALKQMYLDFGCDAERNFSEEICEQMKPQQLVSSNAGVKLTGILRNITFNYLDDTQFSFLNGIDGMPLFSIYAYDFSWSVVGQFVGKEASVDGVERLTFTDEFLTSRLAHFQSVSSRCSQECGPFEIKSYPNPLERCCWTCSACPPNSYYYRNKTVAVNGEEWSGEFDEAQCVPCDIGFYSANHSCKAYYNGTINSDYWYWIMLMTCAFVGLCGTAAVAIVFLKYRNTPIVLAADHASSSLILLSCALTYCSTFVIMSTPSTVICAMIRFCIGISGTLLYSTIFAKSLRIMCIFTRANVKPYSFFRHRYSLAYVILTLLGVELLLIISWITIREPIVVRVYDDMAHYLEDTCDAIGLQCLVVFALPIFVALLSTIIAFKMRKIPDGFNEHKGLLFVVYTNSLLLISFVPPLFSGFLNYHLRIISLSIQSQLNATVVLVGLFLPKIYIMIFRPAKNTKMAVMSRTRTFSSKERSSNAGITECEHCESVRALAMQRSLSCETHTVAKQSDASANISPTNEVTHTGENADELSDSVTKETVRTPTERPRVRFSTLDVRALVNEQQDAELEQAETSQSVTITELEIDHDSGCFVGLSSAAI